LELGQLGTSRGKIKKPRGKNSPEKEEVLPITAGASDIQSDPLVAKRKKLEEGGKKNYHSSLTNNEYTL